MPHPDIVSESGRAMTAHQSVLVFDVLGVHEMLPGSRRSRSPTEDHRVVQELCETYQAIIPKNVQEAYHDACQVKEEAPSLFTFGYLDLRGARTAERLFWNCCEKILRTRVSCRYVPEELQQLEEGLADIYYCNFSVFQSAPDHWAIKQLFPIMPIHRLEEKPTRRGVRRPHLRQRRQDRPASSTCAT